jgi:hypothetical protein
MDVGPEDAGTFVDDGGAALGEARASTPGGPAGARAAH